MPSAKRANDALQAVPTRLHPWLRAVLLALLVALFFRTFLFETVRIPTSSMEKTLLVGDFVLVSKLHYGARTPVTVGLPFTQIYLPRLELPAFRLPRMTRVARGDIVVFNYPAAPLPLDRKPPYIKRVVGLPGDTLTIVAKVPVVNGTALPLGPAMQQRWTAALEPGSPVLHAALAERLRARGAAYVNGGRSRFSFDATPAVAGSVASWEGVLSVEPAVSVYDPGFGPQIFPAGSSFGRDNYGPVYIPARGDTLVLDAANWPLYRDIITRYEHHRARLVGEGIFEIGGVRTNRYVVAQDYYFVMGDNRDRSADSRVWGFVPMDHVIGKAALVYFSWDAAQHRPRPSRFLLGVK